MTVTNMPASFVADTNMATIVIGLRFLGQVSASVSGNQKKGSTLVHVYANLIDNPRVFPVGPAMII